MTPPIGSPKLGVERSKCRIDFQYGARQVQRNGESFNNKSTFRTFYTKFWAAYAPPWIS